MARKSTRQDFEDADFDISFEGILDIFGNSLYSSPFAFVRELIQNAYDACVEREIHQGAREFNVRQHGEVTISYDNRILTVNDNGAGLSRAAAKERLSKIAFGLKRLQEGRSPQDNERLIGRYGVGLLSAISKSDLVEIDSHSIEKTEPISWTWQRGKPKPVLSTGTKKAHGTTISVHLRKTSSDVIDALEAGELNNIVLRYTRILPVKIICDRTRLENLSTFWDARNWAQLVEIETPQRPHHRRRARLPAAPIYQPLQNPDKSLIEGALYLPRRSQLLPDGYIDVYIRRMHVSQDKHQLLPSWARFIRGFINSNQLERVVSGEAIAEESELLDEARTAIHDCAIELIKKMFAEADQTTLSSTEWGDHLKAAIIDEPGYELLDALWRHLRFSVHTLRGVHQATRSMTLPEYCELASSAGSSMRTVLFYSDFGDAALCSLLLKITGIPIVKATETTDEQILALIGMRESIDIDVVLAKQEMAKYIRPYDKADMNQLLEIVPGLWKARTVLSMFAPYSIPALYLPAPKAEDTLFEEQESRTEATLLLNSENSVIKRLATLDPADDLLRTVLLSVHNNAFMFTLRELAGDELEKAHETNNAALEALMSRAYTAPSTPVPVEAAILVLDIVGSTYRLACLNFDDRGEVFHGFVEAVREVVEKRGGFFDKFTGDGLIAIFSSAFANGARENCATAARFCAQELRLETQRFFDIAKVRDMLVREGQIAPRVRVGLAYGAGAFGSFGGRGTLVGKPMIEACRLCDDHELHDQHPGALLATMQFAQKAGLVVNEHYAVVGQRDIKGLGPRQVVKIFG